MVAELTSTRTKWFEANLSYSQFCMTSVIGVYFLTTTSACRVLVPLRPTIIWNELHGLLHIPSMQCKAMVQKSKRAKAQETYLLIS